MIPIKTAIYKKSIRKNIINLIFATPLFLKNLIYCKIAEDFDNDSSYQPILFE